MIKVEVDYTKKPIVVVHGASMEVEERITSLVLADSFEHTPSLEKVLLWGKRIEKYLLEVPGGIIMEGWGLVFYLHYGDRVRETSIGVGFQPTNNEVSPVSRYDREEVV
jgi:hypothetical protein